MKYTPAELKAARVRKSFSQSDMAEKLGCSTASYNQKENGMRQMTLSDVQAIKQILSLSDKEMKQIFFA